MKKKNEYTFRTLRSLIKFNKFKAKEKFENINFELIVLIHNSPDLKKNLEKIKEILKSFRN